MFVVTNLKLGLLWFPQKAIKEKKVLSNNTRLIYDQKWIRPRKELINYYFNTCFLQKYTNIFIWVTSRNQIPNHDI